MRLGKLLLRILMLLVIGLGIGLGLGISRGYFQIFARGQGWVPDVMLSPAGQAYAQTALPQTERRGPSERHTKIVDVARQVSPAVVSIGVTRTTYDRLVDPLFGEFFPDLRVPSEKSFPSLGSGFIIDRQGHVLTNYHVIKDAKTIRVTLTDGRSYTAKLLDADIIVDVALLQFQGLKPNETLPVLPLGNSDDIMIGETVLAIGNPFGPMIADSRPSVSSGVVSAVKRSFKGDLTQRLYQDMIQTDAAINPGNSGGPLVNLDGQAVGINTFIFSQSGGSAGVGFSIPISRAMRVANEILKFGKVRKLWLDFDVLNLSPYVIQELDLKVRKGALVRAIDLSGPAERAGLEPGDVIVQLDDKAIDNGEDLLAGILPRMVGETVRLKVVRQGQPLELNYKLTEGPQQ